MRLREAVIDGSDGHDGATATNGCVLIDLTRSARYPAVDAVCQLFCHEFRGQTVRRIKGLLIDDEYPQARVPRHLDINVLTPAAHAALPLDQIVGWCRRRR
jgi:hypothetical protein